MYYYRTDGMLAASSLPDLSLETVPPGSNAVLAVAPNRVSLMTGQKRCNVHWLRQRYGLNSLRIVPEPMEDWEIRLQSSESLDKINR